MLGQLCDNGCDTLLDKKKMYVIKSSKLVLEGTKSTSADGLENISIQAQKQLQHIPPPPLPPNQLMKFSVKNNLLKILFNGSLWHYFCLSKIPFSMQKIELPHHLPHPHSYASK